MAYNISEEKLIEMMISDPSWCLFYQRERVKQLLPAMARAYLLVSVLQKELTEKSQSKPQVSEE